MAVDGDPIQRLTEAVDGLVELAGARKNPAVAASFEVAALVVREAAGIADREVDALQRAFAGHTHGSWDNPDSVRAVVSGTKKLKEAPAFVGLMARSSDTEGWEAFVGLMRVAHAAAAADPTPSRREAELIDRIRGDLTTVLTWHGIDASRAGASGPVGGSGGPEEAGPTDGDGTAEIDAERFETALAELDALIGLDEVKTEIRRLADRAWVDRLRAERGLKTASSTRHLVFVGNPGTGKTTVARLVAEIYAALAVVPQGHLVEVGRADLVAGYVGQTAAKTREVFESAIGGMLFIDEAYALVRSTEKDFGTEALDTLVAEMENHRDDTVVVVAGYPREMDAFLDANPGLASRFPKTIEFPDYGEADLVAIGRLMAESNDYVLADEAASALTTWLASVPRGRGFGNARLVRNALDAVYDLQAQRLVRAGVRDAAPDPDTLRTLTAADVQLEALDQLVEQLR